MNLFYLKGFGISATEFFAILKEGTIKNIKKLNLYKSNFFIHFNIGVCQKICSILITVRQRRLQNV